MIFFVINHRNFLATDNCSAVGHLRLQLPTIQIFSSCINENDSTQILTSLVRRKRDVSAALELFADIEMLRHGVHFFGLFDSNLVRMIHRIRFPHLNFSHALAEETYTDSRRTLNQHMDDMLWAT